MIVLWRDGSRDEEVISRHASTRGELDVRIRTVDPCLWRGCLKWAPVPIVDGCWTRGDTPSDAATVRIRAYRGVSVTAVPIQSFLWSHDLMAYAYATDGHGTHAVLAMSPMDHNFIAVFRPADGQAHITISGGVACALAFSPAGALLVLTYTAELDWKLQRIAGPSSDAHHVLNS
jgi:hypothetical protein